MGKVDNRSSDPGRWYALAALAAATLFAVTVVAANRVDAASAAKAYQRPGSLFLSILPTFPPRPV